MSRVLTIDEVYEVKKSLRTIREDVGLVEYALTENIARVQQLEGYLELRLREQNRDVMVAQRERERDLAEAHRGRERERVDSRRGDRDVCCYLFPQLYTYSFEQPTPKAPATPTVPIRPWGEPLNGKKASK